MIYSVPLCSITPARERANNAFKISFHDVKIGKLYWHEKTKKGKKFIFPVRLASREEIVGMALRECKGEKECAIQYIQYPHTKLGKDVGLYDIASKNGLTPYYGNGDKRDQWCEMKFEQYAKQLKRSHKLQDVDVKTEEIFLQCILQKSLDEGENAKKSAEVDEAVLETSSTTNEEEKDNVDSESDEDDDEREMIGGTKRRTRGGTSGMQERTERLKPGDRIQFYKQQCVAGDPSGLMEATILNIDPKADHILTLDDTFTNLEPHHQVKRIQRYERGKLVNNDGGQFRPISTYMLKKEGNPNASKEVRAAEKARVDEIIKRNKDQMVMKMKKDGFCPEDMLR